MAASEAVVLHQDCFKTDDECDGLVLYQFQKKNDCDSTLTSVSMLNQPESGFQYKIWSETPRQIKLSFNIEHES